MKGNEIKEADRKRWEKAGMIPAACRLCGEIMLFPKETYKPKQLAGREERQMIEREKVVRGLEAHANPKACETCAGEDCPYYNSGGSYIEVTCSSFLAADALALLKEQEPRVMTQEEVLATPEGVVVWMEEKSECGTYIQPMVSSGNGYLGNFYMGGAAFGIENSSHRFWTSRPTPDQMRDTPWEDSNA